MKKHILFCTALFFSMHSYGLTTTQPVNFNDDEVGQYQKDDFKKDWLMTYMPSSQKDNLYIIDSDDDRAFEVAYKTDQISGPAGVAFPAPLNGHYNHLFFQYDVKFPYPFAPPEKGGGKLPGLTSDKDESGCVTDNKGFSSRYMWRNTDLDLFLYLYKPSKQETCGQYVAINYQFPRGKWVTLTQEVQLNTDGNSDGYIRVWVNGTLMLDLTDLTLISAGEDLSISYAQIDAFPGGSVLDQWAFKDKASNYFDNFIVSETNPLENNSPSMKKNKKPSNTKAQKKKVIAAKQKHSRTQ